MKEILELIHSLNEAGDLGTYARELVSDIEDIVLSSMKK